MKHALVFSFFIMVILIEASFASCLRSELPEANDQLIKDVWQSLPQKMRVTLCHQNIRISLKKRLISKNGVGLALKPLKRIYIKEEILIKANISLEDYLIAKRNMIHELAHFFFWDHRLKSRELTIISGRTHNGFVFKQNRRRNFFDEASLDHYEFKNEEEFFAVNTELFLTQPDFQCRRPLQNEYLKKVYEHTPFLEKSCKSTNLVPITTNGEVRFRELDFNRLYQIHFLLADAGKDISSRFGHAMIRLVFCSKKRNAPSELCLQDFDSHLVLSFRANVTDEKINYFSGLFGGYESQMHILPYLEVIDEYAGIEKRTLYNYEFNTSAFSVYKLKTLILDQAWTYRGKYKFLSNNCGTEILSFLQLLNPENQVFELRSLTPKNLVKNLLRTGILRDQARASDIILPRRSVAEVDYSKIKSFFGELELEDFLLLSPTDRSDLMNQLPRTRGNGSILIQLQNKIFAKKQRILWNSFVSIIHKDQQYAHLLDLIPKSMVQKGIPLAYEVESIKRELSGGFHPELIAAVKVMFPEESENLNQELLLLESIRKTFFPKEEK